MGSGRHERPGRDTIDTSFVSTVGGGERGGMSERPEGHDTGRRMLGCAIAIILGAAFVIGGLAVAVMRADFSPDFSMDGIGDPGDGDDSAHLPVQVSPRTGLTDGIVVTVVSDAFEANSVVGVAVCLAEAETEARGVDACDEVKGTRYAVSADGRLDATYPVPRVITVGGVAHDCAAPEASNCLVVAASANDYDQSGGQPISFRTDLGPVDMSPLTVRAGSDLLAVIPADAGPVAEGSAVKVTASGFQPGEPVLMAHCAGFPGEPVTSCDPIDSTTAMAAVMFRTVLNVKDHADETGTVTFTFDALASIEPFSNGGEDPVDCSDPASECAFVIAAAADTKRSAVVPYSVTG